MSKNTSYITNCAKCGGEVRLLKKPDSITDPLDKSIVLVENPKVFCCGIIK